MIQPEVHTAHSNNQRQIVDLRLQLFRRIRRCSQSGWVAHWRTRWTWAPEMGRGSPDRAGPRSPRRWCPALWAAWWWWSALKHTVRHVSSNLSIPFFFSFLFLHSGDRDSWATPSFLWMCQTQFIEGYAGRSEQQNSDCPATISGISFSPGSSLSGLQEVSFLNLGSGHVSLSASAWNSPPLAVNSLNAPQRKSSKQQSL